MLAALASAFTQRKVRKYLAMSGEITLRGQVLPVGGIKEKILAAKRAGIKEIILCERNRQDVEDINPRYIKGLTFTRLTHARCRRPCVVGTARGTSLAHRLFQLGLHAPPSPLLF